MSFSWTPHRFSGGALALDIANSVIMRHDSAQLTDRFADKADFAAFPAAATRLCAERDIAASLAPLAHDQRKPLIALRETLDALLRHRITQRADAPLLLADMLEAAAACVRASAGIPSRLDGAAARSALRLAAAPDDGRLKICPNCGWLFIDRSRNKSRLWCDMTVCGNREKARRHYRRGIGEPAA
jgi:predicted RNA-binding Zn ribbon-like protein